MNKEIASQSEAFRGEQDAWKKVLGVEVDIQPLPISITPEVKKNLEKMGAELFFIPSLNLGTLKELKDIGVEKFLDNLQCRYPNWKKYGSLSGTQRRDHSITRNLNDWYWQSVKDEKIDFPRLPGNWIVIEMMPKPAYGDRYAPSKMSEKLGFKDRFDITWDNINKAINREKINILNETELRSGDVRMLEAREWNLLANREDWKRTFIYEWTNTEFRDSGESRRVVVGCSGVDGAADADWCNPGISHNSLGFRVAVVLGP